MGEVTPNNISANWTGNAGPVCAADSSASSEFAQAFSQEAQPSSSVLHSAVPPAPVAAAAPAQVANSSEDLLTFLHAQAGFETGALRPPTFNARTASPFGTAAHAQATTSVLPAMQDVGYLGSERILSEVRVVNGVVTQIGGRPGGPAGSHNIDVMVCKPGEPISVGDNISGGVAEQIGDLKYGGGQIASKYAVHGSPTVTINGRTAAGPDQVIPEPVVENPLLQVTDEQVCRAAPLNANTRAAGNFSPAATNDSAANALFAGADSDVAAAAPHGSLKPGGDLPHSPATPGGEVPPVRPVGGGFGGVARTAAVTGLTVVGTALAVKGTIDDAEEGDYVGAGLNAASIASAPAAIVSGAYHLQKAEMMAYGAILKAGVDSAKAYALYIEDKVTPQQVIESHVDLSDWPAADRNEVQNRYLNGE
jgi:hypothetical protein